MLHINKLERLIFVINLKFMKFPSTKKVSLINVAILAASALTSLVWATKNSNPKLAFVANGRLQASATPRVANQQTCKIVTSSPATCHDTITDGNCCSANGSCTTMFPFITSNTCDNGVNSGNTTIGDVS
jgi:type II secretory pathway pseudopilin PulG